MAGGLQRDHLKWLLSLNLSCSVKNVRRDFSNGFLVAEILSRYYPSEVALHSFDPAATNVARKRDAWELILKLTRKLGFGLSRAEAEAVIACEPDAAPTLVARLFDFLTPVARGASGLDSLRLDAGTLTAGDTLRDTGALRGRAVSPQPRQLHHVAARGRSPPPPSTLRSAASLNATGVAAVTSGWSGAAFARGDDTAEPDSQGQPVSQHPAAAARSPSPPASPSRSPSPRMPSAGAPPPGSLRAPSAPSPEPFSRGAAPAPTMSERRRVLPAALLAAADEQDASLVSWNLPGAPDLGLAVTEDAAAYSDGDAEPDGDAYWAQDSPRAGGGGGRSRVDYVPYTQADYNRLVGARAYWQLGRLGPDLETAELGAKRAARERALEFARQANSYNTVELASRRAAAPPPKAPSSRDRARDWAAGTFAPGGGLLPTLRGSRSASPQARRGDRSASDVDAALWEAAM